MQKLMDFYEQYLKGKLLYVVHIYVLLLCIGLSIFLKITSNIPYFLMTLFVLCFLLVGIFVGFVYFLTKEKLKKIYRFINIKVTLVIILILSVIKGRSAGLENITSNLSYYIITNPIGAVGFAMGILLGLVIFRKGRRKSKD